MAGHPKRRPLLAAASALVVAVALVVTIGVIPPVSAGSVPNITSERAVPALWVAVGLHVLAAAVLLLVMMLSKRRSSLSTSTLGLTAAVILLVGFALADAAKAPLEIGAPLQMVTALLLGCVAGDVVAGALAIAAAFVPFPEGLTSASSWRDKALGYTVR